MTNFLLNPGFETGTPGNPDNWWKYTSGGVGETYTYPAAGRVGGSSVEVTYVAANGFEAVYGQNITVESDKTYRVSGYIKTVGIAGAGGAIITVDWVDVSSAYISSDNIATNVSGTVDWTLYQAYITSPVNAVGAHIIIGLTNCSGSAYFDDMFFDSLPKTETLQDNFNDNSIDASKWNNWGGAQIVETNQELELTTTTAANYWGINSVNQYDLTSSYVLFRLVDPGNLTLMNHGFALQVVKTANVDELLFQVYSNQLIAAKRVSGTYGGMVYNIYDPAVHKWLRIRESAGTTYWDYSTDGLSWTNFWSEANPFSLTVVSITFNVGNDLVEASGTTSKIDDLNILGITTPTLIPLSFAQTKIWTDTFIENTVFMPAITGLSVGE